MIHQRKRNNFLCLVQDVIFRIDVKVRNNMTKNSFFHFYFSNVHIQVRAKVYILERPPVEVQSLSLGRTYYLNRHGRSR